MTAPGRIPDSGVDKPSCTRSLTHMDTYSERLRRWREDSNLSQEQAARALLVSLSTYQSWELGRREPDEGSQPKVDRLLGTGKGGE